MSPVTWPSRNGLQFSQVPRLPGAGAALTNGTRVTCRGAQTSLRLPRGRRQVTGPLPAPVSALSEDVPCLSQCRSSEQRSPCGIHSHGARSREALPPGRRGGVGCRTFLFTYNPNLRVLVSEMPTAHWGRGACCAPLTFTERRSIRCHPSPAPDLGRKGPPRARALLQAWPGAGFQPQLPLLFL